MKNKRRAKEELDIEGIQKKLIASCGEKVSALADLHGCELVVKALVKMFAKDAVKNASTVYAAAVLLKEEWLIKYVARKVFSKKIGSKEFRQKVFNDRGIHYFP